MRLPDPRTDGSKNPGATNVLRLGGKKAAVIVLVFDIIKSIVPMLVGHYLNFSYNQIALVGMAAVLGHVFPIYYRFCGGKGVATALGMYFGLNGIFGCITILIWLLSLGLSKFSSLSSLITVITAPFIALFYFHTPWIFVPLMATAGLIIFKHTSNIQRLIDGSEPHTKLFK